jgi:4-diphosphocytidyl-2-C-methyl-D-erythritol kinase
VPFGVLGGTALGLGRGERLRPLRLGRPFRALIAVPRWRILTRPAFAKIDRNKYGLTGWSAKLRFAQSLGRKSLSPKRALLLGNSFESVLGRRERDFVSLCARLERAGVQDCRMTGSGSAVFGLLAARTPIAGLLASFEGEEALYEARSTQRGMMLQRL